MSSCSLAYETKHKIPSSLIQNFNTELQAIGVLSSSSSHRRRRNFSVGKLAWKRRAKNIDPSKQYWRGRMVTGSELPACAGIRDGPVVTIRLRPGQSDADRWRAGAAFVCAGCAAGRCLWGLRARSPFFKFSIDFLGWLSQPQQPKLTTAPTRP